MRAPGRHYGAATTSATHRHRHLDLHGERTGGYVLCRLALTSGMLLGALTSCVVVLSSYELLPDTALGQQLDSTGQSIGTWSGVVNLLPGAEKHARHSHQEHLQEEAKKRYLEGQKKRHSAAGKQHNGAAGKRGKKASKHAKQQAARAEAREQQSAHAKLLVDAGANATRLLIQGSKLVCPHTGKHVTLKGFSMAYRPEESGMEYATDEDGQIATMFPATNFIRLVMVHWEDEAADGGKGGGKSDCRCPTCKDTGYLKPACITQFDGIVAKMVTGPKMWGLVTVRASHAAGDGGHIFGTDAKALELRKQMLEMLAFLANHYKHTPHILGYEVMSEPRFRGKDSLVHTFHGEACKKVHSFDPRAACVIGPAELYDRFKYGDDRYLLKGEPNVIYAANFYAPADYTAGSNACLNRGQNCGKELSYPGPMACEGLHWSWENHVHKALQLERKTVQTHMYRARKHKPKNNPGKTLPSSVEHEIHRLSTQTTHHETAQQALAGARGAQAKLKKQQSKAQPHPHSNCTETVNKAWLREQLQGTLAFRERNNVPIMIDQWGVARDSGPGRGQYMREVMELFKEAQLHWAYWIWRRTSHWDSCCDYAVLVQPTQGGAYEKDDVLVEAFTETLMTSDDADATLASATKPVVAATSTATAANRAAAQ